LPVELIHSEPSVQIQRQLVRLHNDTQALCAKLTGAEAQWAYEIVEHARDNLSKILDRADGKNVST
jgi:hypothetical protein